MAGDVHGLGALRLLLHLHIRQFFACVIERTITELHNYVISVIPNPGDGWMAIWMGWIRIRIWNGYIRNKAIIENLDYRNYVIM